MKKSSIKLKYLNLAEYSLSLDYTGLILLPVLEIELAKFNAERGLTKEAVDLFSIYIKLKIKN